MDVPYPDIIGEYTDAPTRNEVNGLQYVILYEPKEIIGGEEATVILYLQNLLNVPMKVAINAVVPKVGFLFKKVPFLLIDSEKIELELSPAEVGILNIPAVVSNKGGVSKPNKIEFRFKVKPIGRRSKRVRTPVKTSLIPAYLIDDPVGLNLVGVLGASYKINKKGKKHVLEIPVASNRESDPSDEVETFMYQLLWTMDDYERLIEAHNIINEQRDNIIPVLNLESVFAMMYVEGKNRFDNVGLPLRVGEAIALGKLLAHAATFFLEKPDMQDAVLRPVWNNALRKKISLSDPLQVMRQAGFQHILRLAMALSFRFIANANGGKQPWMKEDRRTLIEYISETLETGESLSVDLMYLPLMLGAMSVMWQVRLPGENPGHTLKLIQKAREERIELFSSEGTAEANQLFDQMLERAIRQW